MVKPNGHFLDEHLGQDVSVQCWCLLFLFFSHCHDQLHTRQRGTNQLCLGVGWPCQWSTQNLNHCMVWTASEEFCCGIHWCSEQCPVETNYIHTKFDHENAISWVSACVPLWKSHQWHWVELPTWLETITPQWEVYSMADVQMQWKKAAGTPVDPWWQPKNESCGKPMMWLVSVANSVVSEIWWPCG